MHVIDQLVAELQNLPGMGPRSARKIILHLLAQAPEQLIAISESLRNAYETICHCDICGNIDEKSPCHLCQDNTRTSKMIAIVENISDLWAIERSKSFTGCYHVLGGVLSAIQGIGPEQLNLHKLSKRIAYLLKQAEDAGEQAQIELILATNLTVEGQTTAHYIEQSFRQDNVTITKLAHGLPAGGELDYMDTSTIITAINARS